jgi:hypothetical protein
VACGCASAVPAKSAEGPAARDVVVAGIAGLLATCAADSYLIGVGVFPVILGHAFFARWRPGALLTFAAFVPLALVPYALSLPADFLTGQPWAALAHSWRSIAYVARILLPPLNLVFYGPSLSFGIAALCVIALVLLGWVAKRRYGKPEWRSRSDLWSLDFCLLMAGLAASSAFIVGFAYPAVHPGLDSQNAVIGAIFGMACVGVAVTVKEPAARRRMLALSSLFVLLLLVGFTPALEQAVRNRVTLLVNAGVTATLGDDIPDRNLHPKRALVAEIWTKARDPYPSFRDRMPFYWIGRSVDELPRRPSDAGCLGNLEWYRYVSTFAAFAVGWGFAQLYTPGIEWIVLANQRGEIVGAGRPAKLRRDIELEHREDDGRGSRRAMQYSGFEATFRLGRGLALSLWLIDGRGQACQVGEPMKVEDLP